MSILSEANPDSIETLFSRDPGSLSDEEISRMVAELRRQRASWNQTEKAKAAKPKLPVDSAGLDDLLKDL